jgi:hypothetical protein
MDYDDFDYENWMLDMHEMVTDLHCTVASLMVILKQKDVFSIDEFQKVKNIVRDSDHYAPIFQDIDEQRDFVEKCQEDEGFLDNVIVGLFGKE